VDSEQLFEPLPPRGFASRPGKSLPLRVHPWLHFCCFCRSASPLFSQSCKRVRNSLKTRKFNSLSFHTHAHSFAVSPLFATHTQNTPGVYVPQQIPRTNSSIQILSCLAFACAFAIQKQNPSNSFVFNQFCALLHSSPASPLFASLTQNNGRYIRQATRRGSRQEPPESRQGLPAPDYPLGANGVRFRETRLNRRESQATRHGSFPASAPSAPRAPSACLASEGLLFWQRSSQKFKGRSLSWQSTPIQKSW
jgi:hypothetical protein